MYQAVGKHTHTQNTLSTCTQSQHSVLAIKKKKKSYSFRDIKESKTQQML